MATERLPMRRIREILRLRRQQKLSVRDTAQAPHRASVHRLLRGLPALARHGERDDAAGPQGRREMLRRLGGGPGKRRVKGIRRTTRGAASIWCRFSACCQRWDCARWP
jgi:hypothetical protein